MTCNDHGNAAAAAGCSGSLELNLSSRILDFTLYLT